MADHSPPTQRNVFVSQPDKMKKGIEPGYCVELMDDGSWDAYLFDDRYDVFGDKSDVPVWTSIGHSKREGAVMAVAEHIATLTNDAQSKGYVMDNEVEKPRDPPQTHEMVLLECLDAFEAINIAENARNVYGRAINGRAYGGDTNERLAKLARTMASKIREHLCRWRIKP